LTFQNACDMLAHWSARTSLELAHSARKIGLMTLKRAVTLEVVAILCVATWFLPGGQDLQAYYVPFAAGCLSCGFNPYYVSWLLRPLVWLPSEWVWPLWTLVTCLLLIVTSRQFGAEPLWVLLSFPAIGQIWLGQIDGLLCLGLALGLYASNPYVRGIGWLLLSIKPQVTIAALGVLCWHERQRWRVLSFPALVWLASLFYWGWDWPLNWLRTSQPPPHVWRLASLYPYGIAAFLSLSLWRARLPRVQAALWAMALAMPFFGVYSYIVFLVMFAPWWAVPLSYGWLLAYPWLGNRALQWAWILPLGLLLHQIWPLLTAQWAQKVGVKR
jgi:hypothetical protein